MLFSLHIENIAVIKKIDVDFSRGFTALTGETGAGKSIIIDSINLLLGRKAEKELIRSGEKNAMVSGVFGDFDAHTLSALDALGVDTDEDGRLFVQRTIGVDGHSQIKLNGRSVNLSILKSLSPVLLAIHGQSDTLSLTSSEKQLELLDVYADNAKLLKEYASVYEELCAARAKIKAMAEKEGEKARLVEMLSYQIRDIDLAGLHEGEEEELIDKKIKIRNSEKIVKNAGFVFKALKGSEKGSVSYLLDRSISALTQISDVVTGFSEYAETLRDVLYKIDDISEEVYAVVAEMGEDSEGALNEIESRLDKISRLKRKYGFSVKEILDFRARAAKELSELSNSEDTLRFMQESENKLYLEAERLAKELHARRVSAAALIEDEVKKTLEFLDMPKVVFYTSVKEDVELGKKILTASGSDHVEFYISSNRGADAKPLGKIASGGELARIMLALKTAIAGKDNVATLIFDEIDAGVSGKTARKIGIKMLQLARSSQIFSVTHSAQIASLADHHLLINKRDVDGATQTEVTSLDGDGRIAELSRILGGIDITESQRNAAKDMLDERKKYITDV